MNIKTSDENTFTNITTVHLWQNMIQPQVFSLIQDFNYFVLLHLAFIQLWLSSLIHLTVIHYCVITLKRGDRRLCEVRVQGWDWNQYQLPVCWEAVNREEDGRGFLRQVCDPDVPSRDVMDSWKDSVWQELPLLVNVPLPPWVWCFQVMNKIHDVALKIFPSCFFVFVVFFYQLKSVTRLNNFLKL